MHPYIINNESTFELFGLSLANAEHICDRVKELINLYHYATVTDVKDLSGITGSYKDNGLRWYKEDIRKINIEVHGIRNGKLLYKIKFPSPKGNSLDEKEPEQTVISTSEPLNITIHIDDLDDPDDTLAEVFKYVHTIKDRPIFISIL